MDGHTDELREGGLTCPARALKFSRKLWRYKKFAEKMSALRCKFLPIYRNFSAYKPNKQFWSTDI